MHVKIFVCKFLLSSVARNKENSNIDETCTYTNSLLYTKFMQVYAENF